MAPSKEAKEEARVKRGLYRQKLWRSSTVELPRDLGEWMEDEVSRRQAEGDTLASKNGIIRDAVRRERARVQRNLGRRKTRA